MFETAVIPVPEWHRISQVNQIETVARHWQVAEIISVVVGKMTVNEREIDVQSS
jgi:hypothetical protein